MVELITKHYNICGERIPIELKFYDNGHCCGVVAKHLSLGFTVSTNTGEDMDNSIISGFESIFKGNMRRYSINNIDEYLEYKQSNTLLKEQSIVLIENPDSEDEGFMIGTITSNN